MKDDLKTVNEDLRRQIAEREQAERALRESEERFRSYFELGLIGMAITSPAKGLVEVNDEICRILGYERSELLRMSWTEFTHPDDLAADVANFNRVVAGEIDGYSMDKRFIRKDGRVIDATISGKCLRRADGSIDYFVALLQEITERKQAEKALAEQVLRYKTLMETSTDSIYVLDQKGDLLEANAAFLRRRGYAAAEIKGLNVADWDGRHNREQLQERLRTLAGGSAVFETQHRGKDGSIFDVEVCVTSVRIGGEQLFFVVTRDITERKQAEEAVHKVNRHLKILSRRRIQEQEEERRRLSRELHDQIGQSLTAAKINVEMLRSTTDPDLIGRLDETSAILDQLLGQVRQISLDLRPPMLDDLGLVPALRFFVDEQGRRASVAVRFSAEHVPEKLDPEIQITCFRIAQEAITNAVRHAKATQLDIALRCTPGKKLRLLARDNGIGFDAHPTQAQAVDLGLIGIKERAALVGGRAKIISSPRKGTTIDVSLPLAFRPERQAHQL